MQRKELWLAALLAMTALLSVACSSTNAAAPALAPSQDNHTFAAAPSAPSPTAESPTVPPAPATKPQAETEPSGYQSQVVEGGNVTVEVLPVALKAGSPSEFEIAMNTHSVDLSADMLKAVVLEDDMGKEYAPTKWDGPAAGGHHRSGKIEFPALSSGAKSVTLIVKDIAKVAERTFKWELKS